MGKVRIHRLRCTFWLLAVTATTVCLAQESGEQKQAPPDELRIEGIVVDPRGGGVSGVEIRLELPDAAESDPPLVETASGNRGAIEIAIKRPSAEKLRVRATKDGFATYVGELDISDPDETPYIDITLQGGATLDGVVTGVESGRPLAGIKVLCHSGGKQVSATTGADGSYSLTSVYYGTASLTVSGEGYATHREVVHVADDQQKVDFQLSPERPVELTVFTNTGKPAEGVVVEAIAEPLPIRITTTTDAAGQAKLRGLSVDCIALSLRLNGEDYLNMRGYDEFVRLPQPHANKGDAAPAPVKVRVEVTLAGRVKGIVTDRETGKPVHGVRIVAGREPRYDMPMTWSAVDGTYELQGVRPGIVTITFQDDDYATAFIETDLRSGKSNTLDAAMEKGVALAGAVVDEEGNPLDNVRIVGDGWRSYRTLGLRATTNADGAFAFAHVPAGDIECTFVRPGYGDPLQVTLAAGKRDHKVTLPNARVPREAALRSVSAASSPASAPEDKLAPGRPVPDLTVTALDGTKYTLSDLRGKYVMLDCWASWCRPCIGEVPNVKAVYDRMKTRSDFVLIGISLDTDRKALDKALAEHKMTWPQVFGPNSGASEAFDELDGVGIPYICLIGPDGKLIAQHLRGPNMVGEVESGMKEKR